MDALMQSLAALSVHSGPSSQCLQSKEPAQQLPIPFLASGLRSSRPRGSGHISTLKTGIGIVSRQSASRDALALRIPQGEAKSPGQRTLFIMQDSAAGGYATALLEIAQLHNMLEVIAEDVEKLSHFLQNGELYDFLTSPSVDNDKKKSILKDIADDAKFQAYTLNFLNLVVDKKRIGIVKDILKEFKSIYNELTDTQEAVVSSALKLENHQLAQIAKNIQRLTSSKYVRLRNIVDPSLTAGFIINYAKDASCMIDICVKDQLEKLSMQIDSAKKVRAFGM